MADGEEQHEEVIRQKMELVRQLPLPCVSTAFAAKTAPFFAVSFRLSILESRMHEISSALQQPAASEGRPPPKQPATFRV